MLKKVISVLIIGSLIAGCDHFSQWGATEVVTLPESSPLSTQELVKVASTCRKEVEGLEKRSAYVPEARKSEYNIVLRMASDNCSELEETLQRVKQATYQKEGFAQNLHHAQSTLVQNATKASPPKEETLFDFSDFEPDDTSETPNELQEGPLR